MISRPKIKVPISKIDRFIEKVSFVLLIFLWAFTIFSFIKLPEIIPIHFDALGTPNGYGNKLSLFLLPVITSVLYICLTYLNKYPWVFNYIVQITEENAESQYSFTSRMIQLLKCSMMLIFTLLALYSYWTANGKSETPGWWFLPLFAGILFIPLIYMFIKGPKDQKQSSIS